MHRSVIIRQRPQFTSYPAAITIRLSKTAIVTTATTATAAAAAITAGITAVGIDEVVSAWA